MYENQLSDSLKEESNQRWLLTLVVLRGEGDDDVILDLSSIPVKLSEDEDGKAVLDEQTTRLKQMTLRTRKEYLIEHTNQLGEAIDIIGVDTFLDEFATTYPQDDDDLKTCLNGLNKTRDTESFLSSSWTGYRVGDAVVMKATE